MRPGEILFGAGDIEINPGREVLTLTVRNTGDRPVQVGSHFHFAESNEALDFDRRAAWGHRLAVPAGTSVRFEPGIPRDVALVALVGARIVPGLRGLSAGPLDNTTDGAPSGRPTSASPPDESDSSDSASGEQQAADAHRTAANDAPEQPENGSPR